MVLINNKCGSDWVNDEVKISQERNKCHFKCNMEGRYKWMVTLRAPRYLALFSSCLDFSVGFSESASYKRRVKRWYTNQHQPLVPTSFMDNNVELNIYNLFLTTFGQTLPLYRNNVMHFGLYCILNCSRYEISLGFSTLLDIL